MTFSPLAQPTQMPLALPTQSPPLDPTPLPPLQSASTIDTPLQEVTLTHSFVDEAIMEYPYYFEHKERYQYAIFQERARLEQQKESLARKHITVTRVSDFISCEVKEKWLINPYNMQIIPRANKPKDGGAQELENLQNEGAEYKKSIQMKPLYFGRSTGLGKLITLPANDVSRKHLTLMRVTKKEAELKACITTRLCLLKVWGQVPSFLEAKILSYAFSRQETQFEFSDLNSTKGSFMQISNSLDISHFLSKKIYLISKTVTLTPHRVFTGKLASEEQYRQHLFQISEYFCSISSEYHIAHPKFYPTYSTNYNQTKEALKRVAGQPTEPGSQLAVSSLVIEVRLGNQIHYFCLTSCMRNYTFGNGMFDVPLASTHCCPKEQIMRIYHVGDRWQLESPGEREIFIAIQQPVSAKRRNFLRLGLQTKLIVDIPDNV